jgi:hypothetical protein
MVTEVFRQQLVANAGLLDCGRGCGLARPLGDSNSFACEFGGGSNSPACRFGKNGDMALKATLVNFD